MFLKHEYFTAKTNNAQFQDFFKEHNEFAIKILDSKIAAFYRTYDGKMVRTSLVLKYLYEYDEKTGHEKLTIYTRNSVYVLHSIDTK